MSNQDFQEIKVNSLRLFSYLKNNKALLILTIILGLATGVLQLLAPLIIAQIIDLYSTGVYEVAKYLILLLLNFVLTLITNLVLGLNVAKLSNRVSNQIRNEAFKHLTILPMDFYDNADQGDIISRLTNDIQSISIALQQFFQQLFAGLVVLIGSMVFMLTIDYKVALLVLALTPLLFIVTSTVAFKSNELFSKRSTITGKLQGHAEEMISGQKVISAFNAEEAPQAKFDDYNEDLFVVGRMAQFISSLTNPSTRLVNNITYISVGVLSTILGAAGEITVGQISALLNYALQFAKPVNEIAAVTTQIQAGIASAERVFAILDLETQEDESDKPELEYKSGAVDFDNVSFAYEEDMDLIDDFNLSIKPGQTIAIVGPTGAGKTTLVNLLMRFYEPQKGAIYLDGQNIHKVTRDSVREVYGMVLQDTWLLRGSIYDNIAYGKEGATTEEVVNAAKNAQAHDFIVQLENSYQTKMEDAGNTLSSGQKQLLTIARVFISEPEMLILDEATSDIDTRTEILVQEAFAKLMEGKTSFVIAHRLSTIRDADLIIVMDQGDIVETGTHEELLAKKGFYYNLYNSQFYQGIEA